jgi:hypothetical protein
MWNELIYLERPLTWLEQPEKAEPESVLLLDAAARKRLAAVRSFEALADQRIRDRRQLTVVRVGKPLGPDSGEVPGGPTGSEPAGP